MTRSARPADQCLLPPTLAVIQEDHAIQLMLCNELESVADKLPSLPPFPEMRRLCDRIQRVTSTHFARAESAFTLLPAEVRPACAELAALRQMHRMDELHAQDLIGALWQQARQGDRQSIGQLAYMLRCFFDGCRRAIALKESWIARAGVMPQSLN